MMTGGSLKLLCLRPLPDRARACRRTGSRRSGSIAPAAFLASLFGTLRVYPLYASLRVVLVLRREYKFVEENVFFQPGCSSARPPPLSTKGLVHTKRTTSTESLSLRILCVSLS